MTLHVESPSVREARLDDAPDITSLIVELGYPTTSESMARRLGSILDDPDYRTFVAVVGDSIVGLAGTRVGKYYEGDGLYGQLMVLVVKQGFRGRGIGSALIRRAEQALKDMGVSNIVVHSGNHRQDAHRLYERCCYVHTARRYKKLLR